MIAVFWRESARIDCQPTHNLPDQAIKGICLADRAIMLCIYNADFIFNGVAERGVCEIVQQPDQTHNRASLGDHCRQLPAANCCGLVAANRKLTSCPSKVCDNGVDELVDLSEHADNMVNARVRCVNEDAVCQT